MPTIVQSITIQPGETMSLPQDATVLTITDDTYEATCDLPDFEEYSCYKFEWALNDDEDPSPSLEHQASLLDRLIAGGNEYVIGLEPHSYYNDSGGDAGLKTFFETTLPEGLIVVSHVTSTDVAGRLEQILYFQTFPSLAASMLLKITGPGWGDGLYLKPLASTECITS